MQTASAVWAAARRSQCLSFAKSCSMGFRSGEYLGRKSRWAPAALMARRTALLFVRPEIVADARPQRRHEDRVDVEPRLLVDALRERDDGVIRAVEGEARQIKEWPGLVRRVRRHRMLCNTAGAVKA